MTAGTHRILVSGFATSTCFGVGVAPLFAALEHGLDADATPSKPATAPKDGQIGFAPIDVDITEYVHATRTEDETTRQLLAAVARDLAPVLERLPPEERARMGLVIGNTSGNEDHYRRFYTTGLSAGHLRTNPAQFPTTLINYQAVQVNNALGMMGQSTTVSTGRTAGLDAVAHAALQLWLGKERLLLAGGVHRHNLSGSASVRDRPQIAPSGSVQPFGAGRDGTIVTEAVGLLLLERHEGVVPERALAEVLGWGAARGSGDGRRAAMGQAVEEALGMAGLEAGAVDAVFPSANGTEDDAQEEAVLRYVFGDRLQSVGVYAIKSVVGECLAAAGPLQCIAAIHAMTRPASRREERADPAGPALWPARALARCAIALVWCMAPDGACSTIVLGSV